MDKKKFEESLKVDLKVERAYCIENEDNPMLKDKTFNAVVPKVIENNDIDTLVLQAGNAEITDINVNKALMDTNKDIAAYKKEWFEKVEKDSLKL